MKGKGGLIPDALLPVDEVSLEEQEADSIVDARTEQLFALLQEVEDLADDLTEEQFCGLVHQAVTSCGFTDAVDAWFSLLAITERRIGMIDLRDFMPKPPD